jgi:elongator complex protein 1
LGEALAWRPSGNLIASIKRYGYEGGGEAEEGSAKCEVIFLERNGLQHGSFELREDQEAVGGQASTRSGQNGSAQELKQRRIFRVRHIAWNSDSTVLAVWIEREHEDVGECAH